MNLKIPGILLALVTGFLPLTAQTTYRSIPMDCGGWFSGFVVHSSGRLYGFGDVFGMWRSNDAGQSWQYLQGDFITNETFINACDVATTDADRVTFMNGAGATNSRVYTSMDGGGTWALRLSDIAARRDRGATPIIYHPTNDDELWLASARTGVTGSLWRSLDGGANWSKMGGTTFNTVVATTLYVRPEFPDQIWVGAAGGLYVSANRGVSFTRVWSNAGGVAPFNNPIPTVSAIARRGDGVGYIATNTKGWRITATDYNNPATYTTTATVSYWGGWGPTAATVLADGSFLTDTADGNTGRSTDGGLTWTNLAMQLLTPPTPPWTTAATPTTKADSGRDMIVQDPTNPSRWFMTGGIAPVISLDSGATWKYPPTLNGIAGVPTFKVRFPRGSLTTALIPASDQGGFTVTDGGSSGQVTTCIRASLNEQQTYHDIMSSDDGQILVAAGTDQTFSTSIIARSTNGGVSWTKLNLAGTGLPASYEGITRAIMKPGDTTDFLVLLGSDFDQPDNNPGLYRTINSGLTFTKVTDIPDGVSTGSRYHHGNSWLETDGVNLNTRYLSLSADGYKNSNTAARGFWRSTNGGSNWAKTSTQPFGTDWILCMAVDRATAGRIWVAGGYQGIKRSSNSGDTWISVGSFTDATGVDAANGRIAVTGRRSGDTWNKIYYSDDNGDTWAEKTGPGYRFANASAVAVDPNRAGQIWVSGMSVNVINPPAQPAYEPFNYTAGPGALSYQNGSTGWSTAWDSTANDINATGFTYTSGADTLVTSGGRAVTGGYRNSFRSLPAAYTSGTYWFSFLARSDSSGSGYGGLSLFDGAGTERVFFGQPNDMANWGIAGGTIPTSSTANQAFIVVRVVLGAGNDTATLWINPALSSTPSDVSAASVRTTEMSFDRIRIASANAFHCDEIRFGQTFSSVAPIVSPPSTALYNFRTTHSLAADGSQDLLTPAGDGVANLLKFAFNMLGSGTGQASTLTTPNAAVLSSSGSAGLPFGGLDVTGKLQLNYLRRKASAAPGITYTVEFSDTLASWASNPSATESATSIDATFERVTVTESLILTRRFVRIRVSSL